MWIGYDGLGTNAVSPGPTSVSIRCENPSFAPIVLQISVSKSSVTPKVLSYNDATASRSFGIPRLVE